MGSRNARFAAYSITSQSFKAHTQIRVPTEFAKTLLVRHTSSARLILDNCDPVPHHICVHTSAICQALLTLSAQMLQADKGVCSNWCYSD